jgi:2-phosphosulfolactate phosphatase
MSSAFAQSGYQVRFEWGVDGLDRLAPSDVVVVVDVLSFSTSVTDRVAAGEAVPLDDRAHATSLNGAAVAQRAEAKDAVVLLGGLRNAGAVANAIMAEQTRRGVRTSIAVIAAGELPHPAGELPHPAAGAVPTGSSPSGSLRFAVEDQLGAGAVIDALGKLGIDHTSPEAAAACESFRGLRGAVRHLLTASGSGRELAEEGRRDDVLHAAEQDAVGAVPRLTDGVFAA